jgi:FkbM family methyltransferase
MAGGFLRFATPLAGLRRVPLLGPMLQWASGKAVPRNELVWTKVQSGAGKDLLLRLNPRTGREYLEGRVEPHVQEALQKFLRPGMTFYDLGANIGFFSLIAARLVGESGHVVAFEADPAVAARLRENVERNEFGMIAVHEKAVWWKSGPVSFAQANEETSPDRGVGHVAEAQGVAGNVEVDAVSLDGFAAGSEPDFMKWDVEGAEAEVFLGARKLLGRRRSGVLCEMHSEGNRKLLCDEFQKLGYSFDAICKNQVLFLPK